MFERLSDPTIEARLSRALEAPLGERKFDNAIAPFPIPLVVSSSSKPSSSQGIVRPSAKSLMESRRKNKPSNPPKAIKSPPAPSSKKGKRPAVDPIAEIVPHKITKITVDLTDLLALPYVDEVEALPMLENLDAAVNSSWMVFQHLRLSYGKSNRSCVDYRKRLGVGDEQLAGLKAKVVTAEGKMNAAEGKVKVAEGQVATADGRVRSAEEEASKLKARASSLEEELCKLKSSSGEVCADLGGYMCAKSRIEMIEEF